MRVNEIFYSLEGEGVRAGYLAVFVRFYGCNLQCSYCDTRYSCDSQQYTDMSIADIVEEVKKFGCKKITITGGEPLIQPDIEALIKALCDNGFEVNIETNGSIDIATYTLNPNVIITMDYKSISSEMNEFMLPNNLKQLRNNDVLKFVVGDVSDLNDMLSVLQNNQLRCQVFVSPVFGKIEPVEIVEYIKNHALYNCRVQLQLHKIIWNPNEKGV